MMRVSFLFSSLLLTIGLTGCYTKFFADDEPFLSRYDRNARHIETQVDTIEASNSDLTVIIQEHFAPQTQLPASPFWDAWGWNAWGYDPFWSDPWFDRFFASPWFSVGLGWHSPYWGWNGWGWNPYWAWNGGWGWNPRWGWANPVGPWIPAPIVIAPVAPNDGTPRNFGRIRYSALLPNAAIPISPAGMPAAPAESDARRSSSESALDKRNAVRHTVNQGYYSLPSIHSNRFYGTSSGRRQSSGSGSTVSSSSSASSVSPSVSRSSSSSSSGSSSSGTRTSGRTR